MAIVLASRYLKGTDLEELVSYKRTDGKYVEMTVAWFGAQTPDLGIGIYTPESLLQGEPVESIQLSLEEWKLLRDLLNRDEVVAMLENELVVE